MKSLVVERPGQLEIQTRPLPVPGPGEVRLRVSRAGICGSDVHISHGSNPFARYPRVIGHEIFGHVDALGEGVSRDLGARVVVDPVVGCGHCFPCRTGRPNVCTSLQVIGVHLDGGFSEYCCVPAANLHAVPDAIPDEHAVMIEPFAVAANMVGRTGAGPEDVALVYGAGPIGLTVVQVLKHVFRVGHLIVTDRIDERLVAARDSGADLALNTAHENLADTLAKLGVRPTLIIDAACHPAIAAEAIELASPAGRIGLMGFSAEPSAIIQQKITGKELSIFSSRLNARKFPEVIDWMSKGLLAPEKLITHRFAMDQFARAFDVFEHDQTACCKVLLSF
jgi:L-gulonate 5-dehydrogenase